MSRSYKHIPYFGCTKDRFLKRYANRKLRRKKLSSEYQHSAYKKDFPSWDICDYGWIEHNFENYYKEIVNQWYNWQYKYYSFPKREEVWKEYYKMYIMK